VTGLLDLCKQRLATGAADSILGDEHVLNSYLYAGKRCSELDVLPFISIMPKNAM
jgi:hypothetical protein